MRKVSCFAVAVGILAVGMGAFAGKTRPNPAAPATQRYLHTTVVRDHASTSPRTAAFIRKMAVELKLVPRGTSAKTFKRAIDRRMAKDPVGTTARLHSLHGFYMNHD